MAHNYKQLQIWQNGLEIVDLVYDFVETFPSQEKYNLISQSVRSACSVPANIAEGCAKSSDRDFKRFLEIALGSLYELETHLLITERRNYGDQTLLKNLMEKINTEQKMLAGMIKTIKNKINNQDAKGNSLMGAIATLGLAMPGLVSSI